MQKIIFMCLCVCIVTVRGGSEDDVTDLCNLCALERNENSVACMICRSVLENEPDSNEYRNMNKRGFLRQTRLFPCQCCAFSRHQNAYCCDKCYKK